MKNIKKIAIILFTVILAFCFLVACQNNDGDKESSKTPSSSKISTELKPGSAGSADNPNSSNSPQSSSEGNQSSSNPDDDINTPVQPVAGYKDRITAYLNSARAIDAKYIGDEAFAQKMIDIDEYDFNAAVVSNAIYASPNGNGDGSSYSSPCSLNDGLWNVKPGQTLYLLGGTYDYKGDWGFTINCKGTANAYITIRNYPGEKAVITNSYAGGKDSEAYGIVIDPSACYFILEGIEISNITSYCAYGIACWDGGQNHFIIRNTEIYNIKTNAANPEKETDSGANGILIYAENKDEAYVAKNIAIIENELYNCVTGWCECLSVTANAENVYILENYVHDNTNIGIDFNGNLTYTKAKGTEWNQPRYSIASGNRIENSVCGYAECAGLYCDGARDILFEQNIITGSQYGIEIGSEEKVEAYPVKNIIVRNNIVADNLVTGIRVGGYETSSTGVVYNVKIYNNTIVNNCSATKGDAEIIIAKVDGVEIINNIVLEDKNFQLVKSDFNESYTKNVVVRNNLFYVKNIDKTEYEFGMYAKTQMGTAAFDALVGTNIYEQLTLNSDYSPSPNSPAVDRGENLDVGLYDFYLKTRKVNALDLGAVELQA